MKLTCDMAMDLVGLYKDKVASLDSVEAIEMHLKECADCRKFYSLYDAMENRAKKAQASVPNINIGGQKYLALSKRLQKKHKQKVALMSIVAGVATTVTAISLVHIWLNRK